MRLALWLSATVGHIGLYRTRFVQRFVQRLSNCRSSCVDCTTFLSR
jgi:hypothetical protein